MENNIDFGPFEEWKLTMAAVYTPDGSPDKWDRRFFSLCDLVSSWSEDTSRKIGAVIVGQNHEIRSIGFNGLPRGVKNVPEVNSRENGEKYHWFEHAERNAIYNAARVGTELEGCTIYCNLFPCSDCARSIIQSGIKVLKTYKPPEQDVTFSRSFVVAKDMMEQAGVFVQYFDK